MSCGLTSQIWIDLGAADFPGNQEDHGADGRESVIAAGLAFGCPEEAIQGFGQAVWGQRLHPDDQTLDMGAEETRHRLH